MKKRKHIYLVLLLCSLLLSLACCSGKENAGQSGPAGQNSASKDSTEQKEKGDAEAYYDIVTDTEEFFDAMSLDWEQIMGTKKGIMRITFLGMQFYQEEPVQLWSVVEEASLTGNVYLCMGDGSTSLLFSGVSLDHAYMEWFLDREGNAYLFSHGRAAKLGADGKVLYDRKLDIIRVYTVCQLPDGSIYLLVSQEEQAGLKLAALDPVSGSLSVVDELGWSRSPQATGVAEDGLLYVDRDGIWKLDLKDKTHGAFLLFEGTSYYDNWSKEAIQALRTEDDGSVQILRSNGRVIKKNGEKFSQGRGEVETLKIANVTDEKIPIVMRGISLNNTWFKDQVVRFNQSQTDYYVVLDSWPEGSDADDFVRRAGVEIATGKGPDILCGGWVGDIYSLVRKGVFEDLKPYMDRSGIREEDYFPMAFSSWRDGEKIYCINSFVSLSGYRIDEAVLGGRREPDIGTLMDALLAWEKDAFYLDRYDAQNLLEVFLEGSEDLWGMVDWEKGTCDFGGELFARILQVSRRYGYDERFIYPAVAETRSLYNIIGFDSYVEQEKERKVASGVIFDDGIHAGVESFYYAMAINANSAHKEGAWAFLEFLLGEEAQSAHDAHLPVHKQAFDEKAAELLNHVDDWEVEVSLKGYVNGERVTVTRTLKDLTEEKVAEFRAMVEDARPYPIRTGPLLDIIQEEAAYYFDGTKDIDGVRRIIENRVRLYLEENG